MRFRGTGEIRENQLQRRQSTCSSISSTLRYLLELFCVHFDGRGRSNEQKAKSICGLRLWASMESAISPAALFNAAVFSLHIPTRPLSPNAAPPATSLSAQLSPDQANATDAWVTQLSTASDREEAYYGQLRCSFLLVAEI